MRHTKGGHALGAMLILLAGCAGGGGDKSNSGGGGISSGLTANFVADATPSCPGAPDGLSLRKHSVVGRIVTIGVQATNCNASVEVFAVNFEIAFDPSIAQCAATNPCTAGTVLSSPTTGPHCVCDNTAGHLIGSFSRTGSGTDTVEPDGNEDIARFALEVRQVGSGDVDFLNTGNAGGTALISLSGGSPVAIGGLAYSGGSALGQ